MSGDEMKKFEVVYGWFLERTVEAKSEEDAKLLVWEDVEAHGSFDNGVMGRFEPNFADFMHFVQVHEIPEETAVAKSTHSILSDLFSKGREVTRSLTSRVLASSQVANASTIQSPSPSRHEEQTQD